ncbi:MAG TPA: hypothetical protein VL173_12930 [Vicinamibacterales bacterium]|jgi:hypothetical protein|nr:hypothetical protein [Vicinamibacterales bacterium]
MPFDMTIALPRDARYAATARLIVDETARDAGSTGQPAQTFAARVEDVARAELTARGTDRHVLIAVHRNASAIVVTIDRQTLTLDL